jgi:hypothetical protein
MSLPTTIDASSANHGWQYATECPYAGPLRDGTGPARVALAVRPLARRPLPALLIALVVAATGCLQRSLPLPPPSISGITVTTCDPVECPQGGLIVQLEGVALPNAQVIVDDTAAHASAPTGETLSVVTEAGASGAWRAVLGPVRVRGTATVLAARAGDELTVYQLVPTPTVEVSLPRTVLVEAPR